MARIPFIARARGTLGGRAARPKLPSTRLGLACALASVLMLVPGLATAGPPVLPPATGAPALQPSAPDEPSGPSTAVLGAAPLQRPVGMPAPRPAPPARVIVSAAPSAPVVAAPASPAPPVAAPVPASTGGASPEVGPRPATSPAPTPAPRLDEPVADEAIVPDAALVSSSKPAHERFPHRGLVADARIGALGCVGGLCRGAHDVSPGMRVGGFLGGNVRGWFELGVGGGWGTLVSKVAPGTNALVLYGLDPGILQQALLAQAAGLINVDLAGLAVQDDQLRAAQVGPSVRVHLRPRGRVGAFVGTGVGYNVLRARYQTALGKVGLDFHGIDVPLEANLSVYVHEHVAVGVQLDYMWTWYGVAVLDHPQQRLVMPVGLLQAAARQQGVDLRGQLPQLWTLGLALRGRL